MNTSRAHELESPLHLYQAARYQSADGKWHDKFDSAVEALPAECHVLTSSILSLLCFSQVCGNATLLREIVRQPWLSSINPDGTVKLSEIPPHGFLAPSVDTIGKELLSRLEAEAERVCSRFSRVYLLLSGGLDSRIIAGVTAKLHRKGILKEAPVAVTWGFADSRDAHYARKIAEHYNFEWINIPFGPKEVEVNISETALHLGALHSPEMLHYMTWFERIEPDALVLAGSFGDSIGRAEFSGRHLLELNEFKPSDPFSLLKPEVRGASIQGVKRAIAELGERAPGAPRHAKLEHYMQGYRMRGNLCHALGLINRYATIYQMFTDPSVYGYMWSLHPSSRTDEVYASLLEELDPFLARLPWARNNKAVRGKTAGAEQRLLAAYHDYTGWSAGPLRSHLEKLVDPEWFEAQGVFNPDALVAMRNTVATSTTRVGRINDVWLWLAGFRVMVDHLEQTGRKISYEIPEPMDGKGQIKDESRSLKVTVLSPLLRTAQRSAPLTAFLKECRTRFRHLKRLRLRAQALKEFPPTMGSHDAS
ncbi:MAG: hypothetical protein PWP23_1244 [Candidatus Sumerlaeota bacterium]|nr:hypothetical protein [Candidatus Sumerlaeota bacterium]